MVERNFGNRTLFQGDNLDMLRGLNSCSIDLIATDPPFNKGKGFYAKPDSVSSGASFQDRWQWTSDNDKVLIDISMKWHTAAALIGVSRMACGDGMAAFLCFMAPRLIEMRRVLKPTGAIYLHCDHTASHYMKALMDSIFMRDNFRNEIVLFYRKWTNAASQFQRNHDSILFYSRTGSHQFNKQYAMTDSNVIKGTRQLLVLDRDKAASEIARAERRGDKIVYRDEAEEGVAVPDVWTDINYLPSSAKERTGYPTQKPVALYERIISASSNPGDMVLDPFAGSGTTCVAAERLGRQWIGMDLWDGAPQAISDRIAAMGSLITGNVSIVTEPLERSGAKHG